MSMSPPPTSCLRIGRHEIARPAILAPMSGVSDLPFRTLAHRYGAGMVVTEMVASEPLVRQRRDMLRKTVRPEHSPFVVQLAGRDRHWMAEGARIAEGLGADIIDINMGCPSRLVTGVLSGSALMREPDHALGLVEAVVGAVGVPVTLKMRMGWDHGSLNAPELARRAETAGVQMITVHGRTRCQFFNGTADWPFVRRVKAALRIPVVVNGDIGSVETALSALEASGADAVMVGRGSYGRPWLPGRIGTRLASGLDPGDPPISEIAGLAVEHVEAMLLHYGSALGLRNARKHMGWYAEQALGSGLDAKAWRKRLCETDEPRVALQALAEMYDVLLAEAA